MTPGVGKAVEKDPSLGYVLDWFVTGEWACMWYDEGDYWADDGKNFLSGMNAIKTKSSKSFDKGRAFA